MEINREKANRTSNMNITNVQMISIFDLGNTGMQMLDAWTELKKQEYKIAFKEFPTLDLYQIIDKENNMEVMEFIIEFILKIEKRNRELAKERQARGIAEARKKGIQLGRRPIQIPDIFAKVYHQVEEKEITITQAVKILNIDYKTYKKWVNQWNA